MYTYPVNGTRAAGCGVGLVELDARSQWREDANGMAQARRWPAGTARRASDARAIRRTRKASADREFRQQFRPQRERIWADGAERP